MGMDESRAYLDSADKRLAGMQRQLDALAQMPQDFMGGASDAIGNINASDSRQYDKPLFIAGGPNTEPLSFVNMPKPEPAEAAAKPQPQAVKEAADPFNTLPKHLQNLENFKTMTMGMPAHPELMDYLAPTGRHTKAAELYQAQLDKELDQQRKDRSKQRFTLADAEAQFPGAIKPTESQQTYSPRPAIMGQPTEAPSKFRYVDPQRVLNETQHAALASLIGGNLVNDNGSLLPPSVVNNAPVSGEDQRQVLDLLNGAMADRQRQAVQPGVPAGPDDINADPIHVVDTPKLLRPLRANVFNNVVDNIRQIGISKREQNRNSSEIKQGRDGSYYSIDRQTNKATKIEGPQVPIDGQVEQLKSAEEALAELNSNGQGNSLAAKHLSDFITKMTTHQPATSVNIDQKQPSAFESEVGKKQADVVIDSYKAAQDQLQVLDTTQQGRKILQSGMITGFGAESMVKIGQALRQVGFNVGGSDIENSQAYAALMAQNVGKIIKQFGAGTGLSDADREYAEKMAGGKITLDQKALEKILDMNERGARNAIKRHNKLVSGIKSVIPLTIEEPQDDRKAGVNLKEKSTDELFKMLQEK